MKRSIHLFLLLLFPAVGVHAASIDERDCPAFGGIIGEPRDYRSRYASEWMRFQLEDNNANHLDLALNNMGQGDFSRRTMADIDFLLRYWPNHYRGLEALTRYTLNGGRNYDFPQAECYFVRARNIFPTDANVPTLEGIHYYRHGDVEAAIAAYERAVALNGQSADAHYNLGLAYVKAGRPQDALSHAKQAYRLGYPLPGLRQKLETAGYSLREDS